jgi:multicomponent Na+:H+ antiporter subunit E
VTRNLVAGAWLVVLWITFWRDLSAANLLSGVLVAAALLALFPFGPARSRLRVRPLPLVRFLALFAWSVAKANLTVAWEVLTPRNRIREGLVAVPLGTRDPIVITVISHAITLAPGTMVIDIDIDSDIDSDGGSDTDTDDDDAATVLFVHVLHLRSPDSVRQEVRRLERLAVQALGGTTGPDRREQRRAVHGVEGGVT